MSDTTNHYLGKDKDPMEEMLRSLLNGLAALFWAAVICFLVGLLLSCRTHSCGVGETLWIHDTIHSEVRSRDSIYLHDSIYFETRLQGDTVYITRDRWRTAYKDRLQHDSIYIHKTDTIIRTVEVEKKPSAWTRLKTSLGSVLIFLLAILSIFFAIDWVSRRR